MKNERKEEKRERGRQHSSVRGNKCTAYVSFWLNQILLNINNLLNSHSHINVSIL